MRTGVSDACERERCVRAGAMRASESDACGREQPIARLQPEALLATGNPAAKLRERGAARTRSTFNKQAILVSW